MTPEPLDEREFELVNIIGAELASNQRDLSRHMDLSLGATNMLIRRLIAKGYIRINQLNKRKVQYILTPKGFSEKLSKSVKYTLKTIHSIELINIKVREVIAGLYEKGERNFVILGKSDFARLVEMALKDLSLHDCQLTYIEKIRPLQPGEMLLICREEININSWDSARAVDLIHELAQDHNLVNHKTV